MYVQTLPSLNFREAITISFKKYCTFSGRARRSEFWLLTLFASIIMSFLLIIFYIFFIIAFANIYKKHYNSYTDRYEYDNDSSVFTGYLIVLIIFMVIAEIFFLFPLISAGVRRLHDTGRSGCYYLLSFIPFGNIILLVFFVEDSHQNANEYGPSPKYIQIQNDPLMNNSQIIPVNGMPAPNSQISQVYPQAYPYQQYPQYPQNPQYPQAPIQNNLYQGPIQANPSNQEAIATPMVSP
jgi:uncharacterized membrane protein YhaH (DUF805 family)